MMCDKKVLRLAIVFLLTCLCGTYFASETKSTDYCFCKLKGQIENCNCTYDSVDHFNDRIYPRLQHLLVTDYFGFHKVSLHKPCPFWVDDGKCSIRYCHVETCSDKDVPPGIKLSQKNKNSNSMFGSDMTYQLIEGNQDCLEDHESDVNEVLSYINSTISAASKEEFAKWQAHDALGDFCDIEEDEDAEYVDLRLNPERYTGYKGKSAHRVWRAIYEENCFRPKKNYGDYYTSSIDVACREKQIPYTIISGLHASINIHLCANYLLSDKISLVEPLGQWGPNLAEFERRFHPTYTNGEGPHWLQNLYFLYLLELRALAKAAPYLAEDEFYTGNDSEDDAVRTAVREFLSMVSSFPEHFDEKTMFTGSEEAHKLKEEFRGHFRNISRIMDCVGCEKCKLWGKLQIQGLGTALKILFSGRFDSTTLSRSDQPDVLHNRFHLQRSEIVTLFNSFGSDGQLVQSISVARFAASDMFSANTIRVDKKP